MIYPVKNYKITCPYGVAGSWKCGYHCGVDFIGDDEIYAVADGTVEKAAFSKDYGNYIVIRHNDGYSSRYAHLSYTKLSGKTVKAGEVIGIMGNTGNATGKHLHFEICTGLMRYPADTDPLEYLKRFPDVGEKDWYFTAIMRQDYMKGYEDGTFRPDGAVTRAQLAEVLRRLYSER